jgi:hypothetical protein
MFTQEVSVVFNNKENRYAFAAIKIVAIYLKEQQLIVISELTRRNRHDLPKDVLKSDSVGVELEDSTNELPIRDYGLLPDDMKNSSTHLDDVKNELKNAEFLWGKDIRKQHHNKQMIVSLQHFPFFSLQWVRQFLYSNWVGSMMLGAASYGIFAAQKIQHGVGHLLSSTSETKMKPKP